MPPFVVVTGYKELLQACKNADKDTQRFVNKALASSGEAVRSNAAVYFSSIDAKTAVGFKSTARQKGVRVYQRMRKTTGRHPEYGSLQMKVLWKAAHIEAAETERLLNKAVDQIADRFERVP